MQIILFSYLQPFSYFNDEMMTIRKHGRTMIKILNILYTIYIQILYN